MKFQKLCVMVIAMALVTNSHAVIFKRLPISLLPGTVPAGKFEDGAPCIDIEQREALTYGSFKEEIEEKEKEGIHALFALVTTKDDTAKPIYNFYAAAGLNISLFGTPSFSKNRYALPATDFKDPSNRSPLLNKIYYFIVDGINKEFELIGTDYEIWHSKKQKLIRSFLLADQGYAIAQTNLGSFYEDGKGVPENLNKAVAFYQKAADQGYEIAQTNLGHLYMQGKGVEHNFSKAAKLYKKAADQGYAIAQNNLGSFYKDGKGVPKNLNKAVAFYQKAADQGYAIAQTNLGHLYVQGEGVEHDLSKAAKSYKKAADQGLAIAQAILGGFYAEGKGVKQNFLKAAKLYKKAADQGNAEAQYNLSFLYAEGKGIKQDFLKATELYKKAADQGFCEPK